MHLTGGTYSSRLKYLLLCGSVVFHERDTVFKEWWYEFLPEDAYAPVKDFNFTDA